MENTKKLSIAPPAGEALARYTVNVKPLDVFKKRILCRAVPLFFRSLLKATVAYVILFGARWVIAFVLAQFMGLHERIDDVIERLSDRVSAFGWFFPLLFWLFVAFLTAKIVICVIKARTEALAEAQQSPPEEYAFFEHGFIYSNGRDLVRVKWADVRLIVYGRLGMLLYTANVCDTLFIPSRYFCTEFPPFAKKLSEVLGIRFIRFTKASREHEPMYENAREKIAMDEPQGEPIGELTVSLRLGDIGYLYAMWSRQIARRHHRGLFGILFFFLLAAVLVFATVILQDAIFLPLAVGALVIMLFYAVYVSLCGMLFGRFLLVNRDYKKPVKFVFYPSGFLLVYQNGVSFVKYDDLDLIFEDGEGLGFFFSKKQCLYIPTRYMHSTDGVRLSQFFKVSLFNLDPNRGRR